MREIYLHEPIEDELYLPKPDFAFADPEVEIREFLEDNDYASRVYRDVLSTAAAKVPSLTRVFKEIGIYPDIHDENMSSLRHGVIVKWQQEFRGQSCVGGRYYPGSRVIKIKYPQPTHQDRLVSLATTGDHHPSLRLLAHEFVHDMQYRHDKSKRFYRMHPRSVGMQTELKEAQAYLVSYPNLTLEAITRIVVEAEDDMGSRIYPDVNPYTLSRALESFAFLSACGVTQDDMARLVAHPGKWGSFSTKVDGVRTSSEDNFKNIFKALTYFRERSPYSVQEVLDRLQAKRLREVHEVKRVASNELAWIMGKNITHPL